MGQQWFAKITMAVRYRLAFLFGLLQSLAYRCCRQVGTVVRDTCIYDTSLNYFIYFNIFQVFQSIPNAVLISSDTFMMFAIRLKMSLFENITNMTVEMWLKLLNPSNQANIFHIQIDFYFFYLFFFKFQCINFF